MMGMVGATVKEAVAQAQGGGIVSWAIRSLMTFSWRMGTVVFGLGNVLAVILYFKQDSMLYFPEVGGLPRRPDQNPRRYRSPSEHQVPFSEERIECSDGVCIHAWLLLRSEEKRSIPTLIFFHGNAGNIGLRLPNAIQMLQMLDANVLLVEYRGYGDSDTVTPSEAGLKLDAEAAIRHISKHPKIDASQIFVFGRSLGGAVAFHLAEYAEKNGLPLAGVIVENTFLNVAKMVDHLMPFIAPLKWLVLRIGWHSYKIAPKLQVPLLYLAGAKDQLVPHSHMLELHKTSKLSRLRRIHVVPDGTHNETWVQGGQPYWDAIKSFLKEAVALSPTTSATNGIKGGVSAPVAMSVLDSSDPSLVHRRNTQGEVAGVAAGEENTASGTIPMMPSGIMGIARQALRDASVPDLGADKKDM